VTKTKATEGKELNYSLLGALEKNRIRSISLDNPKYGATVGCDLPDVVVGFSMILLRFTIFSFYPEDNNY